MTNDEKITSVASDKDFVFIDRITLSFKQFIDQYKETADIDHDFLSLFFKIVSFHVASLAFSDEKTSTPFEENLLLILKNSFKKIEEWAKRFKEIEEEKVSILLLLNFIEQMMIEICKTYFGGNSMLFEFSSNIVKTTTGIITEDLIGKEITFLDKQINEFDEISKGENHEN